MEFTKLFSEDWYEVLKDYLESEEFLNIGHKIAEDRKSNVVYPKREEETLFKVFRVVPFKKVKVVIIGQDPYHDGSYDGLAFSNREEKVFPSPSLRNILKEVESDIYDGFEVSGSIDLYRWAEQGVLLLNTAHTVRMGSPGSHIRYWKDFTTKVITSMVTGLDDVIWLLWGSHAHQYNHLIINPTHHVIMTGHPSPLNTANPFKGCKCFSRCNKELVDKNKTPIKW